MGYPESKPRGLPIPLAVPVDAGDWAAGQVDAPPTPLPTGASPVEVKLSPASPEGSPGRSPEAAATFISGLAFCLQQRSMRSMRGGEPRALASLPASGPSWGLAFFPPCKHHLRCPSFSHPPSSAVPSPCLPALPWEAQYAIPGAQRTLFSKEINESNSSCLCRAANSHQEERSFNPPPSV